MATREKYTITMGAHEYSALIVPCDTKVCRLVEGAKAGVYTVVIILTIVLVYTQIATNCYCVY
jgi:hypothetical protein